MQKESLLFFSFLSESTFDEVKVLISEQNAKEKLVFLLHFRFLLLFLHNE